MIIANNTRPKNDTIAEKCIIEIPMPSSLQISFVFTISGLLMSWGCNFNQIHDIMNDTSGWFQGYATLL